MDLAFRVLQDKEVKFIKRSLQILECAHMVRPLATGSVYADLCASLFLELRYLFRSRWYPPRAWRHSYSECSGIIMHPETWGAQGHSFRFRSNTNHVEKWAFPHTPQCEMTYFTLYFLSDYKITAAIFKKLTQFTVLVPRLLPELSYTLFFFSLERANLLLKWPLVP